MEKKGALLFILSGPEPQRTLFEEKILEQISTYSGPVTFVRGLPSSEKILPSTERIIFYNHLAAAELNEEAAKAEFIISRSGYSTVMDMAALGKKSILVPTPGQPEQEYLAGYLMKKQFAFCVSQENFSLLKNLEHAGAFDYNISTTASN